MQLCCCAACNCNALAPLAEARAKTVVVEKNMMAPYDPDFHRAWEPAISGSAELPYLRRVQQLAVSFLLKPTYPLIRVLQ
eukprot:2733439-Pleurochrysis_carterae.AAC.1